MKRFFVGLAALLATCNVSAETLSLNYEGFYDRMKVVSEEDYSLIDMQFNLVTERDGKPCPVKEGLLLTETTEQNILIEEKSKQIFLPFDKQLDSDKAILTFNIPGPTRCTLSMQVVASTELQQEQSLSELKSVRDQFEALYDDLAGVFVAWLLPEIKGVILEFSTGSQPLLSQAHPAVSCENDRCFVDLTNGSTLPKSLKFSSTPTKLRPWIAK